MTQLQRGDSGPNKWLRVAGISILIMAVLAGVSMGMFFEEAMGLKGATLQQFYDGHIVNYRIATVSWMLILICDVLASLCIYEAFRYKFPLMAGMSALLRIVYSEILFLGIMKLCRLWSIPAEMTDRADFIMRSVYGFRTLWYGGLVIFGLHLIALAFLTPKDTKLQLAIRWGLALGGVGYILLHGGELVIADFGRVKEIIEPVLMTPMILGELGLAVYLTILPRQLTDALTYPVANAA